MVSPSRDGAGAPALRYTPERVLRGSHGLIPSPRGTITHAKGGATIDAESYGYDAVGNRLSHSSSFSQALVTPITTNQFDNANRLTLFGSVANSYDVNGNLAQEGNAVAYTWDARNRLKSIRTAAGQTTMFTYDPAGNLIQQADTGPIANLTKTFVFDDLTNIAYEVASDGSFYSVLSGRSIDSHFAVASSNGLVQYGLSDALNSTIATTDQSGTIQARFLYEPFGQTTTTSSYPFQFTGRVPVSANLYSYRARFYNSQTGRFISEDPMGFAGGDSNLYRYVGNNPTGFTDPLGLQGTVVTSTSIVVNPSTGTVSGTCQGVFCNQGPPSQNQPWFGNYCGPGNNPGPPQGPIDICCMLHDQCYGAVGQSYQCKNPWNIGIPACDAAMTACVLIAPVLSLPR